MNKTILSVGFALVGIVACSCAWAARIDFDPAVTDYQPIFAAADEAANPGDVIELGEGVFPVGSSVTISKEITFRGADSGKTVLKASGAGYRVLTVTGGATIEKLAITGGSITSGWEYQGEGVNISWGTLSECVITNNSYNAAGNAKGVGVYASISSGKTLRITRCKIADNRAAASWNTMPGVGLYIWGSGSFRMDNCLVVGNKSTAGGDSAAWSGGGIFVSHSDAQIVNCTFADNAHNNRGGGVSIGGGTPKFYNCIIARNTAVRDPCVHQPDVSASTLNTDGTISSKITDGCFNNLVSLGVTVFGKNGLAADPLFKTDGYTLKNGSPAIGTGVAVEGITEGVDFAGVARDPTSVDLGCYKYVPSTDFSLKVELGKTMAFNDEGVPVTVTYYNTPAGKTPVNAYYAVSATETNLLTYVSGKVTIAKPGTWNVLVIASDGETELGRETSPTSVKVGVRKAYVTSRTDTKPVFPYATSDDAAACLNDVTDLCIDGTEIELDAGSHKLRGTCSFERGVHVYGQGRDLTWINGNGATVKNSAFYVNHADFVLEHLSVTNFYRCYGGAVSIAAGGGTVRDCRFAHNELHVAGSNCSGLCIYATAALAVVENCIFEHLKYNMNDNMCDGIAVCMKDGTVRNCLFRDIEGDDGKIYDYVVGLSGSGSLDNGTFADCRVKYVSGRSDAAKFCLINQDQYSDKVYVRNVVAAQPTSVGDPQGAWSYFYTYKPANTLNCCFEGTTTYGANPADGTQINFSDQKPYHLMPNSSCRNAGVKCSWMTSDAKDLDGNPRVKGSKVDLGCYEASSGLAVFVK